MPIRVHIILQKLLSGFDTSRRTQDDLDKVAKTICNNQQNLILY